MKSINRTIQTLTLWGCWALLVLAVPQVSYAVPKAETYEDAVVRIMNYGVSKKNGRSVASQGTGFFVNSAGYVLTNHHVIDDADWKAAARYEVVYPGGANVDPASLVWASKELDLAVLLVESASAPAFLQLEEPMAEKGLEVYAVGYPGVVDKISGSQMAESTFSSGTIANRDQRKWWPKNSRSLWVLGHNAEVHGGNSGGPLINGCSRAVGVNTQAGYDVDQRSGDRVGAYNYASHISEAIRELRAQNIAVDVVSETCDLTPVEELNTMSFVNTAAIALLAGMLGLLLFKQSRQAVVQGVQKSFVKISSIGGQPASSRPAPVPVGGMSLGAGGAAGGSPVSQSTDGLVLAPANAAASGMSFELARQQLGQQKHGLSFGREARIVDHALKGDGVSRRHFRFSFEQGNYFVEDLSSAGGTYVNERKLKPYYAEAVRSGDTIAAGACLWRVQLR
ncbi:MAG: trypsin-like peptidase domain-containing protein [Pseudomonadales bacterium]